MYHSSTTERNKRIIESLYPKSDSPIRVIIAKSEFGMGINVDDVQAIIHWSCPKTTSSFIQQVGRAGKNGQQSFAITHYYS